MKRNQKSCIKCGKLISLSNIDRHQSSCQKDHVLSKRVYRPSWNTGLTKETDERVRVHADKVRQTLKGRETPISIEGRRALSEAAKKRGLGGYRPHPNKGMYYKDVWFDSSWEVKVAQSLDENNVKWERPRIGFIWNDKGNRYFPDLFLPEYRCVS